MASTNSTNGTNSTNSTLRGTTYYRIAVRRGPVWVKALEADYAAFMASEGITEEYVAALEEWANDTTLDTYLEMVGLTPAVEPKPQPKPQTAPPKPNPLVADERRLADIVSALTEDDKRLTSVLAGIRGRLVKASKDLFKVRKLLPAKNAPLTPPAETIAVQPVPTMQMTPAPSPLAEVYANYLPSGRIAAMNAVGKRLSGKTLQQLREMAIQNGVSVPSGLGESVEMSRLIDGMQDAAAAKGNKTIIPFPVATPAEMAKIVEPAPMAMAAQAVLQSEKRGPGRPKTVKADITGPTVDDDTAEGNRLIAQAFRLGLRYRKGETLASLTARMAVQSTK